MKQLDIGHQLQFPVLLTHKYACDLKVVRLLRTRGAGNTSTQLFRKLEEQHEEAWLTRCAQYLSDWQSFTRAQSRGLITCGRPEDPPARPPVPKAKWLLTAYCLDVLSRIDEVKAQITSTFGRVLKIDSTKKVRHFCWKKPLAIYSRCTNKILWCNVALWMFFQEFRFKGSSPDRFLVSSAGNG